MAIIYSYPVSTPHLEDLLIGTVTFNELDPLSPRNNPTVSFTVQSLVDMISPIVGGQTLQSVTTFGATTTIPVSFFGGISVSGPFKDINNNAGSNTQILSSTGTSVKWIDNNPVTANDFLTALTFNTNDGVLTGTVSNQSNVTVDLDGRYLQGNETITLSGDVTGTGATAITTTLATVNAGIGAFTNANITVNAKGLVTAASSGTPNTNTTYDYLAVGTNPTFVLNAGTGTGYTAGVNLPTTATDDIGGATPGTGMTVDTTVNGSGVITLVTINNPGDLYDVGDIVTITGTTAKITLSGTGSNNANPNLRLIDSAFAFDDIKLTGSGGTTITRTSNTGITIDSTGSSDNWYVTGGSLTTANELSITGNNAAVGATINLSSLADTLQTVTDKGASTTVASTFSGGLTSSGVLTSSGTGINAYTYFTGNAHTGTTDEPPSNTFRNGMAQAWNNSGGSAEWETFWATGSSLTNDATGQANNAASYISGYNRFAPGTTTPIDTRMYKWYGNGELELQNMSIAGNTLPGGGATPTISNPNWRMPITDAPNTGYVLAKSSGSINLEWVQSASSATGTPNSTNYLRGDNTWASIPSGLNYEGIWEAGTIGETSAPISSTTITLVTAPSQTLVTGMRVTGTGITVGATVLISSVTSQTEVVVDTSVSIASGVQVTFSPEGGFPDLTVAANKGDGVLRICTIQGFASPNGFGVAPSFWNVGDWCVFSGTVASGAWTRIPATNAGVTSFSSNFTWPGAGSPPQFIGGNTLSGVAGAVDVGTINLSATAVSGNIDSGKYLRGDNKWDTRITEVQGTGGLTGGSADGGSIAISPQYDTEGNIILSSYPGDPSVTTTAGSGGSTTLTFSTNDAAKIFAGMQVLQIGAAAWVVSSVNYLSGVVTFVGNVTPDPGVGATVDFTAVLTGTSQMIFNAGTGASISEFVSHKAVSTVGLSLFLNDAGFLTSAVTSITGQEPISIYTANPYSATSPRIDLNYATVTADDNVVTSAPSAGTDTLADSDLFLAADLSDSLDVKKFTMTRLKSYIQANSITGVDGRYGLIGGGTSGQINIDVNYSTDDNVILKSYNGTNVVTVDAPAAATATQIVVVSSTAIRPGMVAIIGGVNKTVNAVPTSTTISFGGVQIGTAVSINETIDFISVLSTSKLMFNTGTGTDAFVSNNALSTIDLSLFDYTSLPGGSVFTGMTGCGGVLVGGTTGLVPLPGLTFTDVNSNSAVPVGISETLTIPNPNGGIVAGMDIRGTNSPYTFYGKVVSVTSTTVFQCTVYNTGPIPANEPLTFVVDDCDKFLKSDATWAETVQTVSAVGANAGKGGIEILGTTQNPQVGVIYNGGPNIVFQANADGLDIEDADEFIRHTNRLNVKTVQRDTLADLKTYINSGSSGVVSINSGTGLVNSGTAADRVINVNYQATGTGLPANNLITGAGTTVAGNIIDDDEILVLKSTNGVVQRKKVSLLPTSAGTTDLSKTTSTTNVTINSSTGTDVAIGAATTSVAGVMTKALYDNVILNNAKVTDSGIPAILSDGTLNRTAVLIRGDIGAGTVTSVAANTGLTGGTITSSGTLKVQYTGGASVIMAAFANGVSFSDSDEFIRSTGSSGTASVERDTLGDLKAYIASGAPSGTVTSVGSGNGLTGGAITSSGTLAIDYTNSTTNLINSALVSAITVPVADSILILKTTGSPSAIGSIQQTPISKLPFTNNTGTVTGVTATAPITSSGGTAPLIAIPVASGTANGYLSSGNWTTFNNKTSNTGTVTGVTGTSPVASSGGTAPAISMAKATASVDGYLSSTDWSTFNNKTSNTGTVTSITLAAGSGTGTAVTTSGTFTFTAGTNVSTSVSGTTVTINSTDQYVGTVTGTGTANYVSKWSTGSNQVNSVLRDDGTGVAIGNTPDASYRMLIEGAVSGYKHIGTGNGDVGFYTKNQGTATANILYQADANIGGTNTTVFTVISSGTLEVKGDVIAYGSPSDIRLKENIKPIESALDKAMKLQGVTFDWKEKDGKILDLKEDIGFIAQDVQKVIPELVRENEDGMLSMRHQGIAPILLEAIKELKQEIEELKLNKCNCKCN